MKVVEEMRGDSVLVCVFRLVLTDWQCVRNEMRFREGALLSAMLERSTRSRDEEGQQRRLRRTNW